MARAREVFTAAARAAFASIPLGPAVHGSDAEDRPGIQYGCTDDDGYLKTCASGDTPRWFMADRVSQGVVLAQQITSEETPGPVYPLCQWEIGQEEDRDTGAPVWFRLTYRVVTLFDAHVWIAPNTVDAAEAVGLRWFTAAEVALENPDVAARDAFAGGGYRSLPAVELDGLILSRVWRERKELVSYREGPVLGEDGQFTAVYESVRTLSLWS